MLRYSLTIKLLSDTCCGTGEGNGVTKDVLSTYDKYGLPYIPAKRIKGILRSNADFLLKYKQCDQAEITQLFGTGSQDGALRIGNAQLENYSELVQVIQHHSDIFTPKAVERAYTVQRTSTAIEETGVAKDKSLRTFGSIPKGEIFVADIWVDTNEENPELLQKCEKLLQNCVKLLRRIGLNRTRGYGEVKATLLKSEGESTQDNTTTSNAKKWSYQIELLAPIVTELDYIPGSALQGVFASLLLKGVTDNDYIHNFLTKVRFSNAYMVEKGQQLSPIPLGMVCKKNEIDKIYSLADGYAKEKNQQYTKVSGYGAIIQDEFYKSEVKKRIDYHFTTDPDKTSGNRGDLFTYSLIEEGQIFGGTIRVEDDKLAKDIEDALTSRGGIINLGRSSKVQYGKCQMELKEPATDISSGVNSTLPNEWVLEFLSDTILVNEYGINLIDNATLTNAVEELFGSGVTIEDRYIGTTIVAGYNAKWKLPKRRYQAFSKGTQIRVQVGDGEPNNCEGFIGLLQSEGYGEYRIRKSNKECYDMFNQSDSKQWSEEAANDAAGSNIQGTLEWVVINEIKGRIASRAHTFINGKQQMLAAMSATEANRLREPFRLMLNKTQEEAIEAFCDYIKYKFSSGRLKNLADAVWEEFCDIEKKNRDIIPQSVLTEDLWNRHRAIFFMTFVESCIWSITILKRKEQ